MCIYLKCRYVYVFICTWMEMYVCICNVRICWCYMRALLQHVRCVHPTYIIVDVCVYVYMYIDVNICVCVCVYMYLLVVHARIT